MIVTFKRAIGVDPLSSFLTVYSNGVGTATVVYGGRNGGMVHHFVLGQAQLRRLKRLLQRTRLPEQPVTNTEIYVYWVITPNRAGRLQEGTVPRSAKPLLDVLNAIANANHLF